MSMYQRIWEVNPVWEVSMLTPWRERLDQTGRAMFTWLCRSFIITRNGEPAFLITAVILLAVCLAISVPDWSGKEALAQKMSRNRTMHPLFVRCHRLAQRQHSAADSLALYIIMPECLPRSK